MSLSLQEQLQSVSDKLSSEGKLIKAKPTQNVSKAKSSNKASWHEYATYGVELLKAYFPHCFKETAEIQPLKKGIKQDLIKRLSTLEIVIGDKACMVSSLAFYVNSSAYHKTVVVGAPRIDLDGHSVSAVTPEEAQYSVEYIQNKVQKKTNQKTDKK